MEPLDPTDEFIRRTLAAARTPRVNKYTPHQGKREQQRRRTQWFRQLLADHHSKD